MRCLWLLGCLVFLSGPLEATSFSYDSQLAAELAKSYVLSYQRTLEQPILPDVEINDPLVFRRIDGRRMLVFVVFSAASQMGSSVTDGSGVVVMFQQCIDPRVLRVIIIIPVDPDEARTIGRGDFQPVMNANRIDVCAGS